MRPLDDLDLAILAKLESDARITVSELARCLDSPNSTIRDRIRKLEQDGVIRAYTAVIAPEELGMRIKATVQVTRDHSISLETLISEAAKLPEVTNVQLLTGDTDELITIYARDVAHLKDIIYNKLGSLPGLIRMSTAIVLDERSFPLTQRFGSWQSG
jgi:Lrp/AsnC family leucine-responsive transcriptional regulator